MTKNNVSGPGAPIRVVIADDHHMVRAGMQRLLSTIAGIQVVDLASNGRDLIERLETADADLVITDLRMPVMSGLEALAVIRRRWPRLPVIVASMHDSFYIVRRAMAAGAAGYITKDAAPNELQALIERLFSGDATAPVARAAAPRARRRPANEEELTQRQVEILMHLAKGLSSKEIAFAMDLSPKTVDVHRLHIMRRLGLNSIPELTRWAIRHGLVDL